MSGWIAAAGFIVSVVAPQTQLITIVHAVQAIALPFDSFSITLVFGRAVTLALVRLALIGEWL